MENLELKAVKRDTALKAKEIRKQDRIPAVVYGDNKENLFIDFDYQEFRKLFRHAGHNTLINLIVEGEAKPIEVLIHMVDHDPVSGNFQHVDIRRIKRGVKISTEVNIIFEGISEAVKTLGGILVTSKTYLDVKCLPKDLIHEVKVDLGKLVDFHSKITVADIVVPETVEVLNASDELVAMVTAPRAVIEEESAPAEAVAPAEGSTEDSKEAEKS